MASSPVQVLLARRPQTATEGAFGHVDVSAGGRRDLQAVMESIDANVDGRVEVDFHPDDEAGPGEVLTASLRGFDRWFQEQAAWSLERAVAEIRRTGLPDVLDEDGVRHGRWSFYAIRTSLGGSDVVAFRAKSPTYGLGSGNKLVTLLFGSELRPVDEPVITFDRHADALVVNDTVYIIEPRAVERLLVDADAVKARARETSLTFATKIGARLSERTTEAIHRVCSRNANVARRVERLNRDGVLSGISAAEVRAALADANLESDAFGRSGPLTAESDDRAIALIDIAADLYYQPRFSPTPRRVATYRNLK